MAKTYNLYDILGVDQEASDAQIRTAFRQLTLKHHPDRHVGEDREQAEERFQAITEAFNVLSRPDSRKKYDDELAQGQPGVSGAAMDPREIARKLAAKGAQTMREGRVKDALTELKSALDHDDNCSRAHYFMGLALAKVGDRSKDALRHLERAVQLEPGNAIMLSEAAALALSVGMRARAKRFAEEALGFDPTNAKATKIIEQCDDDEPSSGGEGFFGRLRRKG